MQHNNIINDGGLACHSKATRLPWGDTNVKINVGLTNKQFKKRKKQETERCANHSSWTKVPESTIVRQASEALTFLISDHWHSKSTFGHSKFNYQSVSVNNLKYATVDDATYWGIDENDPFIHVLPLLKSGFKADDAPMPNWPTETASKTIGAIFGFFWKNGLLSHSRYSAIVTIISGEGCHSNVVRYEILTQLSDLSKISVIVFWCFNFNCWICIDHKFLCCFDWPFECSIGGFLGPTSKLPFHGLCQFIDGECLAVNFDESKLKQLFESEIPVSNFDIDFDEWTRESKSGYVLTTTKCIQYQAKRAQKCYINALAKAESDGTIERLCCNGNKLMNLRRKIAHQLCVYTIKNPICEWEYSFITDFFHAFNNYNLYTIKLLGLQTHCIFKNPTNQSKQIFSSIQIPFVLKSFEKYIDSNKSANLDVEWHFTSNGFGYKLICNKINSAINTACWIEHRKLNHYMSINNVNSWSDIIDMSRLIPTMKFAASYVAHKYLRRGWSILWSSTLKPNSMQQMKFWWRKGFYILLNFIPEVVCLFMFKFFVLMSKKNIHIHK